jgi:carbamate kinase
VGPVYTEQDARRLAAERGWTVAPDGTSWRRVVASPEPLEIVELAAIRLLATCGVTVTCAGGGGIPVVRDEARGLRGVEAVIDKDLTASLLARRLGADALVLLTDVDAIYRNHGSWNSEAIRETTPPELRALRLPKGSMGPKAEAIARFVEAGGALGAIGTLADAPLLVQGRAGTVVRTW